VAAPPPHLRLRRGTVLLGGALTYLLLVAGPLGMGWTPPLVGLVAALAALAGGRGGGLARAARLLALGLAATAVAAGVLHGLRPHVPAVGEPGFWVLGLGLLGALDVLRAVSRPPGGEVEPGLR
jgi:hypothetical protein